MTGGGNVAWVPQHPTLLRGSVADNIRLGDATASDERVLQAAALAGADGFIEALPRGHETLVGDGGRPLSAGERRRLGLARAFLRDAPLVVLDEPTADLDPLSAELVADAVERVCAGRTVLLIAHRPELVRRADRVIRLERGRAPRRAGPGGGLMATLRRLLALAGAAPSRVALAVVLGALTVVFGAGLMATAGYLITRAAEQPAILSLMTAIVAVRFFGIARPLARYFERLASHDLALRVLGRVRVRVYERIEPLAPAQLEGYSRGDLLSRMVADVDAFQNLYLRGVGPPLVALLAGALCVGAMAAFLPAAALVLAVGLLASGIAVPVLVSPARKAGPPGGRRRLAASSRPSSWSSSAPRRSSSCTAATPPRSDACEPPIRRSCESAAATRWPQALGDGLGVLVAGLTVAIVLALSVGAHAAGELDRVLIAMLALLALASFEAVQPLSAVARELPATLGAGRRILELIDREPAVVDPAEPAPAPSPPFAVALEDVSARYAPHEPAVLDGFSLRLEPGARIALLGASGAGKTTVVNLLLRFLDPEQGRVTLGERDLRDYRQDDVRRAIAVAGQDSHLFSASIRENVRLARPEAGDAEVEHALARARLWHWVQDLPDGLDTLVGEQGRQLSAGQRQRLVIARALLTDAPVLVLDEPTAHLDPPTAERLMEDVLTAAGERSVLLITHRPEGLGLVDEVVVLP